MILHWLIYLTVLIACTVFSVIYQGWLGWILLLFMLMIPLFSLVVSLPAMLSVRLGVKCATMLTMGDLEYPQLSTQCLLPAPPIRGHLRITHSLTGESLRLKPGKPLPTEHCGQLVCTPERVVAFDYLGLFRLGVARRESTCVTVRPHGVPMYLPADLETRISRSWYPKPGGGFSENHELRLYRPGDSLNQIHWKLTAKTGKLVIREAMAARQSAAAVVLALQGSADEMDRKLGRLLWAGHRLLKQNIQFDIRAFTGSGMLSLPVNDENRLLAAVDTLLAQPPMTGDAPSAKISGGWQLHIGGDDDGA